jgi:hypothetical protein
MGFHLLRNNDAWRFCRIAASSSPAALESRRIQPIVTLAAHCHGTIKAILD